MIWALVGSFGVGAIAFLVQAIRLAKAQGRAKVEIVKREKAEAESKRLTEDLQVANQAVETANKTVLDQKSRYEKVSSDTENEIHRLQELLSTCNDPKVVHERLTELGKIVKIV
jgi:hypothetical protein